MAYEADYFRWHSLGKDENDLPDVGVVVETLVINNRSGATFYDHNWITLDGNWAKVGNAAHVIRWRYISD